VIRRKRISFATLSLLSGTESKTHVSKKQGLRAR
jgi:hypothetical protein